MLYCKGLTRFLPSFHFLHISVGFPPVFLLSLSRSAVITVFLFYYFFLFFSFYVEYRSNQNLVSCRAKDDSKLIFFFPYSAFPRSFSPSPCHSTSLPAFSLFLIRSQLLRDVLSFSLIIFLQPLTAILHFHSHLSSYFSFRSRFVVTLLHRQKRDGNVVKPAPSCRYFRRMVNFFKKPISSVLTR